jgi:hypothetical protein
MVLAPLKLGGVSAGDHTQLAARGQETEFALQDYFDL